MRLPGAKVSVPTIASSQYAIRRIDRGWRGLLQESAALRRERGESRIIGAAARCEQQDDRAVQISDLSGNRRDLTPEIEAKHLTFRASGNEKLPEGATFYPIGGLRRSMGGRWIGWVQNCFCRFIVIALFSRRWLRKCHQTWSHASRPFGRRSLMPSRWPACGTIHTLTFSMSSALEYACSPKRSNGSIKSGH